MPVELVFWFILIPPLVGAAVLGLAGRGMSKGASGFLAVATITISFISGLLVTKGVIDAGQGQVVNGPEWISLNNFRLPFEFLVDQLSMTMVLIITGIGALIHLYATAYMAEDRDFTRFFAYMNLFVAAMLILVLGNNLGLLFIGWEGVGLCSYLLIGFWYKDLPNARAANKAFIVNRIGDWGLMLGLFMIVAVIMSRGINVVDGRYLSYDVIARPLLDAFQANPALATTIALLLFVGAAGKSAQFPLYFWLPDAMAGPTPVSALIHAATMVTSGVFLLNRMHFVFEASPLASGVICVVGAFTAAFAAVIAFGQTDIKRVLAYSTVSQLGFMFIACGAGAYWAGMFHVTTHAFFKALLFLGAGAVIYSMSHNQDMRNYGNLRKYLPITFWCMVAGWLAISGVFGLSGYFSKEAIIASALGSSHASIGDNLVGPIAGLIGLGVAALTAVYMTRLTFLTFLGKEERWRLIPEQVHPHGQEAHATAEASPALTDDRHGFFLKAEELATAEEQPHHELDAHHTPKEAPLRMTGVLVVLALLSVAGGFVLNMNGMFEHWLAPVTSSPTPLTHEAELPVPLWALSSIAALGGILFGLWAYRAGLPQDQGFEEGKWKLWRREAGRQFGYDYLVTTSSVDGGGEVARGLNVWFEKGVIDLIVNGVGVASAAIGGVFKTFQTGYVRLYALVMLVGSVAFIGYFAYVISQLGGSR